MKKHMCYNKIQKTLSVAILIMLAGSPLKGEPIPSSPDEVPDLSISEMISDLQYHGSALSSELAQANLDSGKTPELPVAQEELANMTRANSEISFCLARRGTFAKRRVIPTDPYYRALQRKTSAEIDLQTAVLWWKYCKHISRFRSLGALDDLPMVLELKREHQRAEAELAALGSKSDVDKPVVEHSPTQFGINSVISRSLYPTKTRTESVLDRIAGWRELSEEERSKIIAR